MSNRLTFPTGTSVNSGLPKLILSVAGAIVGLVLLLSYATAAQLPTETSLPEAAFLPKLQAAEQVENLIHPGDPSPQNPKDLNSPAKNAAPLFPLAATLCTTPTPVSVGGINGQPAIADMADGSHRIVFWSTSNMADSAQNRDGNIEIFVADVLTSGVKFTQVSSSTGSVLGGFNLAPSISEDGSRVAFFSDRDLVPPRNWDRNFEVLIADISAVDGSVKITQVTSTTKGVSILPSLSASGSHVAYISDSDGNMEVFLAEIGADYTITRAQVTATGQGTHDQPSVSADGKRIAFVYDDGFDRGIRMASWVSGSTFVITNVTPISGTVSDQPSISADGNYIAFVSNLDLTGENADGNQEVFLAQIGAGFIEFTQATSTSIGYNDRPSLSTDGTRFAYVPADNDGIIFYDKVYSSLSPVYLGPPGTQPAISSGGGSLAFISSDENSLHGLYMAQCGLAGLSIGKSVEPGYPVAGDYLTYTLIVSNAGPSPSVNVVVTDELPSKIILESVTPSASGWNCVTTTNPFICEKSQLNARTVEALTVVGKTTPETRGGISNTAIITGNTLEYDLEDNDCTLPARVVVHTDLSVTLKSVAPKKAVAGSNLTYTLAITNNGPSNSTGLTLTSKFPSNVVPVGLPTNHCYGVNHVVTCTWGGLAAGFGVAVPLSVHVDQYASLPITFTSAVTSNLAASELDPEVGNNETGAIVAVGMVADLELSKTSAPAAAIAGDFLTYTLVVHNDGPSAASNVRLTDTLPSDVTFSSVKPITSCALAPSNIVTCAWSSVAWQATIPVTIVVKVGSGVRNPLYNAAVITSSVADDPDLGNNTPALTTLVSAAADLWVSKSAWPAPAVAGKDLTYTLSITNVGPSNATNVHLTDTMPSGVIIMSVSKQDCDWTSTFVSCTWNSLLPGQHPAVTVRARVVPELRNPFHNNASVDADEADPGVYPNTAQVNSSVLAQVDLWGVKSSLPADEVLAGKSLTYTLVITNDGPSRAMGVKLTDTLPLTATISPPSGVTCAQVGVTLTCALPDILPLKGYTLAFTMPVGVFDRNPLVNTARVGSQEVDTNPVNNELSDTTIISATADISVTKRAWPGVVVAGNYLTYTFVVTNWGPGGAADIMLTDILPSQVSHNLSDTMMVLHFEETGQPWLDSSGHGNNVSCAGTCPVSSSSGKYGRALLFNDEELVTAQPLPLANASFTVAFWSKRTSSNNYDYAVSQGIETLNQGFYMGYRNDGGSDKFRCSFYNGNYLETSTHNDVDGKWHHWVCTYNVANHTRILYRDGVLEISQSSIDPYIYSGTNPFTVGNGLGSDHFDGYLDDVVVYSRTLTGPDIAKLYQQGLGSLKYSQGTCDAGDTLLCNLGDLWPHTSATVTLQTVVDPLHIGGTIPNTALADGSETDPVEANNSSTTTTIVAPTANLVLDKTAAPEVFAGERLTYTLVVSNIGVMNSTGVWLTDTLPMSVTFISASISPPTGRSCTYWSGPPRVICNLATIPSYNQVIVTIPVTVSAEMTGTLLNQAIVKGNPADNPGDNVADMATLVNIRADLSIGKSVSSDEVWAGDPLTYTLRVTNTGPSLASGVIVTDELPADSYLKSRGGTGWICNPASGNKVVCTRDSLAQGVAPDITIVITAPVVNVLTTITNTAIVTSTSYDPTPVNTASITTTVKPHADLAITKSDYPDPVVALGRLTYTLRITNAGPSVASMVRVTDTLPDEVSYIRVYTGSIWACSYAPVYRNVTCTLDSLDVGPASAYITIVVSAPSYKISFDNTAEISSTIPDLIYSNNISTTNTLVNMRPVVDLDGSGGDIHYETTFTEGGGAVNIEDSDMTVSDVDNTTLDLATVTITNLQNGTAEVLAASPSGAIGAGAISYNSGTGVLTIDPTGTAAVADFQAVLRTVTYNNTSENPNTTARLIDFMVNDGAASNSPLARTTLTVAAVNDRPVVDLDGSGGDIHYETTFTEGGGAVNIEDSDMTVSDVDNTTLDLATVTITNLQDGTAEVLAASPSGAIGAGAISYNSGTGVLTIDPTGTAAVADFQAVLRTVTYNNTSTTPNTTARLIDFMVNDGAASNSPLARTTLTVIAVLQFTMGRYQLPIGAADDLLCAIPKMLPGWNGNLSSIAVDKDRILRLYPPAHRKD